MLKNIEEFRFEDEMQNVLNAAGQILVAWPEKVALGAALSSVFTFLGADIILYYTFLAVTFIDFFLGVSIGCKINHHIDLHKLSSGVKKLVAFNLYILLSGIASMTASRIGFGSNAAILTNFFIGYLIFHEMISILRNMEILGFTQPPLLKKFIQRATRNIEKVVTDEENSEEYKK